MNVFEFVLGMTESLAWPVTVIAILILLRKDIGSTIRKIRKLRHKDTELDFESELDIAVEVAAAEENLSEPVEYQLEMVELARFSPRGAIIESWLKIEKALKDYAERHGIQIVERKPFSLGRAHTHSPDYERLGKGTIETLRKLRLLRNEAVHLTDADLNFEAANRYQELAQRVLKAIEKA